MAREETVEHIKAMKHTVMVIHEVQERRNKLFKEIEEL